ncbi:MAG: hypothetical protein GY751_21905 [Bacteroidetes bacterium]|nr:hypothetical protein [Bacteroidota bacterium]
MRWGSPNAHLTPQTNETKKKPKRKPLPEHLERKEQVLTPGDQKSG